MAKVWKVLALLLVITALVWLTTLWRWQSAHLDPSGTDVVLQLLVLPALLTGSLLALVWGVKHLRRYAASPAPVAPARPAAAATGAAAALPATAEQERAAGARVLATAVQLRAGASWADAQASIAAGDCKVELHPELRDDDGVAVFTAAMADLQVDTVADTLAALVVARSESRPEWAGYTASDDVLRALTLLESCAADIQAQLELQWPALAVPLVATRHASSPATRAPAPPPTVAIRVGIPARWPSVAQQVASAWIEQLFEPIVDAGLQAAGQSRAMANTVRPAVQLHVHPVDSAEALWQLIEQQLTQWQREQQPGLLWVLAADSLVDETHIARLDSKLELFSGRNQRGRVPGEAAASLLIASALWSPPEDTPPPLALLHKASAARRDKSADASGRITGQTLSQALSDTLQGTRIEAAQVQHLTTDADHRASRTAEVYETSQELLPHLDAGEQSLRLGLGCGDTGIARLLACAALSATQVDSSSQAAVILATHSPFDRLAILMAPWQPPGTEVPAAAAAA